MGWSLVLVKKTPGFITLWGIFRIFGTKIEKKLNKRFKIEIKKKCCYAFTGIRQIWNGWDQGSSSFKIDLNDGNSDIGNTNIFCCLN